MTEKRTALFDLIPGQIYKHNWITKEGGGPQRMLYFHNKKVSTLDISQPLLFIGKLDCPKLTQFQKHVLSQNYNFAHIGLFVYKRKLICMQYYYDIHYEKLT